MLRTSKRSAFTLVELLIVIGIIALLISILLPALGRARSAAQQIVCESGLRQFGLGMQMYADQSKGMLPQKGPDGSNSTTQSFGVGGNPANGVIGYDDPSIWFNAIPPFVNGKSYFQMLWDDYHNNAPLPKEGDRNIFICPTANPSESSFEDTSTGYFWLYGTESAANPQHIVFGGLVGSRAFKFASSYCFNSKLTSSILYPSDSAIKMSMLRPGSEVVLMTEKMNQYSEYRIKPVQDYNNTFTGVYNGKINSTGYIGNIGQSKADWRRFTTRHRQGGNILFADGHVAWFSWLDAQIQPSQMPGNHYNGSSSDANQPGKMIWSVIGPVN